MFWRVPGFSQPSPVEQILDKEEYTLEELLDEDDIIQECKSLNGRLVAFLRERSSVEQLIRYLVEPQDSDDPKRTYKYPFTSCEVLCCELEAVYNTLLEDAELMQLLFSLLEQPAPLSCKTAGYFGRVVGNLLMRKSPEMLEYMQRQGPDLLTRLVQHVDTTSIADIVKRMVGADDQNSLMGAPSPAMGQWLAETPLLELLLARLDASNSAEAQANAADILSATAHTQPSALAARLTEPASVAALVGHALAPGRAVLVPALDVCIALLEPRRAALGDALAASMSEPAQHEAAAQARNDAVMALVEHVPQLVELLSLETSGTASQDTPFGRLCPPLGRHRLKVVELLAALVRSGIPTAEQAIMGSSALPQCMRLFSAFPFNNLLHHNVAAMLVTCMTSCSEAMTSHLFGECRLLDWIIGLPQTVSPAARPGDEANAASRAPLRAGYLGHVTQVAGHLAPPAGAAAGGAAVGPQSASAAASAEGAAALSKYTAGHEAWGRYVEEVLVPRQELENTQRWACGRPAAQPILGMDSDGDDYSNEMDLEHMAGMQQPLYHRYSTDENEDEEDDDDDDDGPGAGPGGSSGPRAAGAFDLGSDMISEALSGMDLNRRQVAEGAGGFEGGGGDEGGGVADPKGFWTAYGQAEDEGEGPVGFGAGAAAAAVAAAAAAKGGGQHEAMALDDDDVLLGTIEDDEGGGSPGRPRQGSPPPASASPGPRGGAEAAAGEGGEGGEGGSEGGAGGGDAMVVAEEDSGAAPAQQAEVPATAAAAAAIAAAAAAPLAASPHKPVEGEV